MIPNLLDWTPTIEWSKIFRNSFDSIRLQIYGGVKFFSCWIRLKFIRLDSKIYDSIDSKVKNNLKNSIKINSKFVRFDSTPPLQYTIFEQVQKRLKNQFEIRPIRLHFYNIASET